MMKLKPFNSFGPAEYRALIEFASDAEDHFIPLSGYLAGKPRGGYHVVALEEAWAQTFKVKHAIACNSATSGLLAAAFAVGLGPGDQFVCPAMTMSATAAAPMLTGATPVFCDVEDEAFALAENPGGRFKAVFITNLFGHPATLKEARKTAEMHNDAVLIEDNSQSPFAMENGKYTGTIGHIGVCSLNVHKPIQCGEGGMITTDDDNLAGRIRAFINHGETAGLGIGLNLRMPEVCACIALIQLQHGLEIIEGRRKQADAILSAIGDIPGCRRPVTREGCTHAYYAIPFLLDVPNLRAGTADCDFNPIPYTPRRIFCTALSAAGVPIVEGYVPPLYRLPAFAKFARPCPVAEDLHDRRLFYFENCAWDVLPEQIEQIGAAFRRAAEMVL